MAAAAEGNKPNAKHYTGSVDREETALISPTIMS